MNARELLAAVLVALAALITIAVGVFAGIVLAAAVLS